MLSLEFTRSFKLLFSGDLSPSSFVFSSFVVQFSRSVLLPALADSLYSISHRVRFVKSFFKTFFKFFAPSDSFPAPLTACRLFDSLSIISLRFTFVKRFFQLFQSFLSLFFSLPRSRDTALPSVHLFYHFIPLLSTLFCLFLSPLPLFRCFAHFC